MNKLKRGRRKEENHIHRFEEERERERDHKGLVKRMTRAAKKVLCK